jgi:hypothetical protein
MATVTHPETGEELDVDFSVHTSPPEPDVGWGGEFLVEEAIIDGGEHDGKDISEVWTDLSEKELDELLTAAALAEEEDREEAYWEGVAEDRAADAYYYRDFPW